MSSEIARAYLRWAAMSSSPVRADRLAANADALPYDAVHERLRAGLEAATQMMCNLVHACDPFDHEAVVRLGTGMLEDAVSAQGNAVLTALAALRDPDVGELLAYYRSVH